MVAGRNVAQDTIMLDLTATIAPKLALAEDTLASKPISGLAASPFIRWCSVENCLLFQSKTILRSCTLKS